MSGSSLTFKLGPSTLMACPEDVMKQADAFIQGLSDTASYQMDKASLVLRDAQGADLMVFAVQVPVCPHQRNLGSREREQWQGSCCRPGE